MQLWIKIGVPIGVLTFVAVLALSTQGQPIWAAIVVFLGLMTVLFTRRSLLPLGAVTQVVEGIASGDLRQGRIEKLGDDEIARLARATNSMTEQLRGLAEQAEAVARGEIGVVEVEGKVLKSGVLADADLLRSRAQGDLERSFVGLTNQMRRLTIQARVISRDQLYSPLLDERVPGELGDAFGLMVKNLRTIADRANDIAGGDLTSNVQGTGDLTSAFNRMVTGLNGLVEQIMATAIQISTASEEILVVLKDQELAASHQASGVEETQRTMETLLSSARRIAESTQTVFRSAEKTQANNRTVADRIGELKSHTARISEILEVIKSIADRSDLLALNASLEGMRAGEAGKGFTLVAAEMRRLAENIKESIGDVKELITDIRESSLSSVVATEEGSLLSEQTTDTALKISLITQQQQSGTEQVTQSMEELSLLINQGVSGTRQVTTAAQELADSAEALRYAVEKFQILSPVEMPRSRRGNGTGRRVVGAAKAGTSRSGSMPPISGSMESLKSGERVRPISGSLAMQKETSGVVKTLSMSLESSPAKSLESLNQPKGSGGSPGNNQESPTVEFQSLKGEDDLLFAGLAKFQREHVSSDSSQEFDAIARELAGGDDEESEKDK